MKFLSTILISCTTVCSVQALAQQDTIRTENIEIIKEYKPFIEDGKKQEFQPFMPRVEQNQTPSLQYSIPQEFIETKYEPDEIRPLPLENKETTEVKKVYLKAGYGNQSNPLARLAINGLQPNNYSIGAIADFEAVKGDLIDQKMNKADLTVYGNKELSSASLHGEFDYNRLQNNFYGYDHEDPSVPLTYFLTQQIWNTVGGRVGLESTGLESSSLYYDVNGFFTTLSQDLNQFGESQFGLTADFGGTLREETLIGIETALVSRATKTPLNIYPNLHEQKDLLLHATPYIKPTFGNIKTSLGVSLNNDKTNGFKVFPDVSVEIPISENQLKFYAGWNGRTMVNGFQQMYLDNPWLSDQSTTKNYTQQIMTPAGLKGNIGDQFGFNLSVSQIVSENIPLYVNGDGNPNINFLSYSRFTPVYETKLSNWKPSADLNYQFGQYANVLATLDYNIYKTKLQPEAWQLPKLEAGLTLEITPIEKLKINGGFQSLSGIKYLDADYSQGTLDGIFNLNLGAQFDINDNISLFLDGNNLTNSDQMKWKNYSTVGTNILAGIVLSY